MSEAPAIFVWLHRRGIVRALSSTSSSAANAPVTVRFETWPRVPGRVVAFFADRYFRDRYELRAGTYCRRGVKRGEVTVRYRRIWIITYGPSIRSGW